MRIFVSWSGDRSKFVAEALRDWLPDVIQALEPWMSSEDIDKGSRWFSDIITQLNEVKVGIICLTPENLESAWILFEAGALSKTLNKTFVCTYLLDIEPGDISAPLGQFQATKANKEDTKKILCTINKALGEEFLTKERLESAFERCWPDFEKKLEAIPDVDSIKVKKKKKRTEKELLEEILELVRAFKASFPDQIDSSFLLKNVEANILHTIQSKWDDIVDEAKRRKISLGSFLAEGSPHTLENGVLQIEFSHGDGFHVDVVRKNRELITRVIQAVTGYSVRIICEELPF